MKHIFEILTVAVSVLAPTVVTAAPIQLIPTGSSVFTPGMPFALNVTLPAIDNLGAYNINLLLDGTTGIPGMDFRFDVAASEPAATGYVFPSSANFFDASNTDLASRHRLTLSDFDLTGVDVRSGSNDLVAHVIIQTSVNYKGDLSVSVDVGGLILDTPDVSPTAVLGFGTIESDTLADVPIVLSPVPEPSALVLIFICVPTLLRHRCLRETGGPSRIRIQYRSPTRVCDWPIDG